MPTINELKPQRGQLGTEASRILQESSLLLVKSGRTKEETARAKELKTQGARMLDDADAITEQITLLERSNKLEADGSRINPSPRPAPGGDDPASRDAADSKLLTNATEIYLRFGEAAMGSMCKPEERAAFYRGRTNSPARYVVIGGERRGISEGGTGLFIVPQEI